MEKSLDLSGIKVVSNKSERKEFLNFIYRHYKDDEFWVPPLLMEQKKLIDFEKNPFYKHGEAELFLAELNGEIVGRIGAVIDHKFNKHHGTKIGFFSFFECINHKQVASLLFRVVNDWLAERGMDFMQGPTAPSMMDEIGVLTEGFQHYPSILMPYTKPFYPALLESVGFEPVQELLAFRVDEATVDHKRMERLEPMIYRRYPSLNVRKVNLKYLEREAKIIHRIYNAAWSDNWGFTPLSLEEIMALAKDLKSILDKDLAFIAEIDNKPVAFTVSVPDMNKALRHLNGRLLPFGIFKLLYHSRKIKDIRTALMGVDPKFQGKGLDAILHLNTIKNGIEKGFTSSELSWVLESNKDMCLTAEKIGARVEKRYRIYGKAIH